MTDTLKSKILPGCSVLPAMKETEPVNNCTPEVTSDSCGRRQTKLKNISHGRRWKMLNTFIDTTASSLSKTDAMVWMVLFRDTQGKVATTAQSYIASRLNISRRTVVRSLDRLKRLGLINIVSNGGLNGRMNKYIVQALIPGQDECVTVVSHKEDF